jgi:hypothetical protein
MDYRKLRRDHPDGKVIPDREDYDWVLRKYGEGHNGASCAYRYRLAQARKLIRLHRFQPAD